nr:integrase, catalytic region, zinc finger, CCHC-type, peptidase aspartic, catalytic [Tanacetum cinerariifolium]
MANLSKDIQCAGFDTRPPMLDRTDFAAWQQSIRFYCRGKENGVNILKLIDEGPLLMGTFRETLAEGEECALHLGLPKDIYTLINHYIDAKDIWDNVKLLLEGTKPLFKMAGLLFRMFRVDKTEVKETMQGAQPHCKELHSTQVTLEFKILQRQDVADASSGNGVVLDEEQLLFLACGRDNAVDEDVDELPVQDLALNVKNVF